MQKTGLAVDTTVSLGEGIAVIRRKGVSAPVVAQILGVDRDGEGRSHRIYLDRRVHRRGECQVGEYEASGAVSTILEIVGGRE